MTDPRHLILLLIPKNYKYSLPVSDTVASIADCRRYWDDLKLHYCVNGTLAPSKCSFAAWRRVNSSLLQFGLILKPCLWEDYLGKLMSSPGASAASPSQLLASGMPTAIPGISSPTSAEPSTISGPLSVSSKTSRESSAPGSGELAGMTRPARQLPCMSLESYNARVTEQRLGYSRRKKQGFLNNADASSLSPLGVTSKSKGCSWTTPTAAQLNTDENVVRFMERRERTRKASGAVNGIPLGIQVRLPAVASPSSPTSTLVPATGTTRLLSAAWVSQLMGIPVQWVLPIQSCATLTIDGLHSVCAGTVSCPPLPPSPSVPC